MWVIEGNVEIILLIAAQLNQKMLPDTLVSLGVMSSMDSLNININIY